MYLWYIIKMEDQSLISFRQNEIFNFYLAPLYIVSGNTKVKRGERLVRFDTSFIMGAPIIKENWSCSQYEILVSADSVGSL